MPKPEKPHKGPLTAEESRVVEYLYVRFYKTVYAVLRKETNHHLAEDHLHDTFVRICENISQIRDFTAALKWIYTIADRLKIDKHRKELRDLIAHAESLQALGPQVEVEGSVLIA
jgi:DNA-directed RNA polymerase specialized sigma24 family protein